MTGDGTDSDSDVDRTSTDSTTTASVTSPGSNYKIRGEVASDQGTGVVGQATAGSTTTYGVYGETTSNDKDAAGVLGHATNSSGTGIGVHGKTSGDDGFDALGMFADATNVNGRALEADARGGNGDAISAYADVDFYFPVYASHEGAGGRSNAVFATTASADAAAVHAEGSGGGALEALGHVNVTKHGCEAYLSTDQTISSGGSYTTVTFDSAPVDHFGGFDTSTGEYTVQKAGDYRVDTMVDYQNKVPGGTQYNIQIDKNDLSVAKRIETLGGTSSSDGYIQPSVSKTLFDLQQGDTITVQVYHTAGSDKLLDDKRETTYVTITKVG